MPFTVIEYYGKQNSSRCGYCKGTRSSHSHGMHAYIMAPQDYQDLIDRGWRRSGHYCYKPNNKSTCCPSYTIRCDATEFKLTKSHKKILKRMNKFLTDGVKDKEQQDVSSNNQREGDQIAQAIEGVREEPEIPNIPIRDVNIKEILNKRQSSQAGDMRCESATSSGKSCDIESKSEKGETIDDSRPPRKKAKQMRLERKKMKLAAKGVEIDQQKEKPNKVKGQEKTLREYIEGVPETSRHKLRIKLVEVGSDEFKATLKESFGLYEKYQITAHNDPPSSVEDYLFFLVKSPLKCVKTSDGPPEGYGSFHQQYWLDDKLIAVGVIDILPHCISSVYFFYDPDYSFLSLGTYGSLREIDFTRQLYEKVSSLRYYYMGFYIHSCPKMKYKGKLVPSYLLCPEVYTWHLLTDEIRSKLDEAKYQRLNVDISARDENEFTEEDVNSVLISIDGRSCIRFRDYIQILGSDNFRDIIAEYGRLTGRTCAQRMLFLK